MTYPSNSITERWINMIVAEGGSVPTSFSLGELMKAYAEAEGGGSGWPTTNGTGAGNLTAETAPSDNVGYSMTDRGSEGITLASTGTGPVQISSVAGLALAENSTNGISITESGAGQIDITGSGGVQISNAAASTGVLVGDTSSAGVQVAEFGTGGVSVTAEGSTAGNIIQLNIGAFGATGQLELASDGGITGVSPTSDITFQAQGGSEVQVGNGVLLDPGGGQFLSITNLPTSNPGGTGRVWNNAGVLSIT